MAAELRLPETAQVASMAQLLLVGGASALVSFLGMVFPGWLSVLAVAICAVGSELIWLRIAVFPWQPSVTPRRAGLVRVMARFPPWRLVWCAWLLVCVVGFVGHSELFGQAASAAAYVTFVIVLVPANGRVPAW